MKDDRRSLTHAKVANQIRRLNNDMLQLEQLCHQTRARIKYSTREANKTDHMYLAYYIDYSVRKNYFVDKVSWVFNK